MMNKSVRTFAREAGSSKYREVVQINEAEGTMKIYCQDKEIGFPFSEYVTGLAEAGYESADAYYKGMTKRERAVGRADTVEVDTKEQVASEIEGLINLAKYRKENGCYRCLVLKDGTMKNDVIERLMGYGLTETEAVHKIALAFGEA